MANVGAAMGIVAFTIQFNFRESLVGCVALKSCVFQTIREQPESTLRSA
jgi:hypothetical protein